MIIKFIIGVMIHYLVNFFLLKKKILFDDLNHSDHKKMINNKSDIILSGGFIFFLLFLIYPITSFNLKLFIFLIFIIGLISDLKILDIPSFRFFLQILVVVIFVNILNISISFTDLKYLDFLLDYKFFSIFFTILCFLVLINGSNFLDGLNTLVIVYNVLVLSSLVFLTKLYNINYDLSLIKDIILILIIILIFNLLNKSFLGDSGAYSISTVVGFILIDFFKTNENFSVLFIVVMLWYPAFETLFSIIRKLISKFNPAYPDNNHFHQLLFCYVNSRISKRFYANISAAILINVFNLLVFLIAILNYQSSILLSFILISNITIYIYLFKKLNNER